MHNSFYLIPYTIYIVHYATAPLHIPIQKILEKYTKDEPKLMNMQL